MTPSQRARLHDIRRELEWWPRHPSPKVQERYRATTPEAVAHAVAVIDRAVAEGDGHVAFKIIEAWHKSSETGVVEYAAAMQV